MTVAAPDTAAVEGVIVSGEMPPFPGLGYPLVFRQAPFASGAWSCEGTHRVLECLLQGLYHLP